MRSAQPIDGPQVVQVLGHTALGGAVPVVVETCRVCEDLGLRPVVLATHPDVVAYLEDAQCAVWEFPGIIREPSPLHDLQIARQLGRGLANQRVQIVHTHTSKGGMVGRLAARLARTPLVIHHTHGFYHSGLEPGLKRSGMVGLEWAFSHITDYQLFVNTADRDDAVSHGFLPAGNAVTIFNGVQDPLIGGPVDVRAVRATWGIPVDAPVIGQVTRIAERKGVDTCLRAFGLMREAGLEAWMVVVGKGSELGAMQGLAVKLGISERVRFLGHIPDAGKYYGCFDLAVSASEHEGQSISVIEALACGTPVVASDIRGHRDMVVDGLTGLLCPVGDAKAFSRSLADLLGDRSRMERMSRQARRRYEDHFTSEEFRTQMTAFYKAALVGRGLTDGMRGGVQ